MELLYRAEVVTDSMATMSLEMTEFVKLQKQTM